jgi:hypothetical protein
VVNGEKAFPANNFLLDRSPVPRLRQEPTMTLKWMADRLKMGTWTCLANRVLPPEKVKLHQCSGPVYVSPAESKQKWLVDIEISRPRLHV